jgi:hypothetical protein
MPVFKNKNKNKNKNEDAKKELAKSMVARLALAYGVKKKALPALLGCSKNAVNNWGYYGRVPFEQLEQCHIRTGVSMDWLLYAQTGKNGFSLQQVNELTTIMTRLVSDAIEFLIIKPVSAQACAQLTSKLQKDLLKWQQTGDDHNRYLRL